MKRSFSDCLRRQRALFILRGSHPHQVSQVVMGTWEAGARLVEITLNTPRCLALISSLSSQAPSGCLLGAGTVRRPDEVRQVVEAGARFLVTPIATRELVEAAHRYGLPIVMGAATPTEVFQAWSWGADFVKLFPVGPPAQVRRLRGPLPEVPLVAVGGVGLDNARAYLDAGCAAVAVGGAPSAWIRSL